MKPTKHEIFKFAHQYAKAMKAKWPEDSYRVCFALALRETYRQIEEHNAKAVAKAAADAAYAALAVVMTGFRSGAWPQAYVDLHERLERVRHLSNQAHEEETK